jgi:hypothetical protein
MGSGSVSGGDGLICLAFGSAMGDKTDHYSAAAFVAAELAVAARFGVAPLCWTD